MKKLLLILLCLPMIGFGQVDKIIFSSGDTIYGKVIEVGVNDITYQYKGETTNNVSKKRDVAKVIYSSGRVEKFDGLQTIIDREKVKEKEKVKEIRKKHFLKELNDRSNILSVLISGASLGLRYNKFITKRYGAYCEVRYGPEITGLWSGYTDKYKFYTVINIGGSFYFNTNITLTGGIDIYREVKKASLSRSNKYSLDERLERSPFSIGLLYSKNKIVYSFIYGPSVEGDVGIWGIGYKF